MQRLRLKSGLSFGSNLMNITFDHRVAPVITLLLYSLKELSRRISMLFQQTDNIILIGIEFAVWNGITPSQRSSACEWFHPLEWFCTGPSQPEQLHLVQRLRLKSGLSFGSNLMNITFDHRVAPVITLLLYSLKELSRRISMLFQQTDNIILIGIEFAVLCCRFPWSIMFFL